MLSGVPSLSLSLFDRHREGIGIHKFRAVIPDSVQEKISAEVYALILNQKPQKTLLGLTKLDFLSIY